MSNNDLEKEIYAKEFLDSIRKTGETDIVKMHQAIAEAKYEWEFAQSYFDSVSEPELVEYAIYNQTAAQKKYEYLLRQARQLKLLKK